MEASQGAQEESKTPHVQPMMQTASGANINFDHYFPTLMTEMTQFDTTINLHELQTCENREDAGNQLFKVDMINMLNRVD